ncbi:hypothetical protein KIN20_002510 [Parelaphostrongylus tenuis]|uniref:Uncharacterized protein n=1 Tax=Parelaphostrongylus tenuis TaxID=148309 RepID=A0AAD5QFD1_PARTN|nr:hypothetical protein KIN20_002510 [Parelaphostrongylus tenuis]
MEDISTKYSGTPYPDCEASVAALQFNAMINPDRTTDRSRCANRERRFNAVVKHLAPSVPVKLAAQLRARIRSVSAWVATYGDSVINNVTVIMSHLGGFKSSTDVQRTAVSDAITKKSNLMTVRLKRH